MTSPELRRRSTDSISRFCKTKQAPCLEFRGRLWKLLSGICVIAVLVGTSRSAVLGPQSLQKAAASGDVVPLSLSQDGLRDATLKATGSGSYEIVATGNNPTVAVSVRGTITPSREHVLAFEYFSAHATHHVRVEFGSSPEQLHSFLAGGLSHSERFTPYAADLLAGGGGSEWKGPITVLRLGFEATPGQVIQLRNLVLRAPTEQEQELAARQLQHEQYNQRLDRDLTAYLAHNYPASITSIYATKSEIRIKGELGETTGPVYLAEVPLYENLTELKTYDYVIPVQPVNSEFHVALTRFRTLPDHIYDRVFSRWVLLRKDGSGYELLSHAHYADAVESRWNLPDEQPSSKKGLGGVSIGRPLSDLDDLGIRSITVNVFLGFLLSSPGPDRIAFTYGGKSYYADEKAIQRYDRVLEYAAQRKIIVSAILLVPQARSFADPKIGKLMAYPDADPAGAYAMPNLTSADGLQTYAAALTFLAKRYSRPDKKYGRIHHWIMHNEVDAGWVWTNAGEQTELTFLDLYQRSMRTMYYIARQYNPHAKVFISLTHYWNWTEDKHFYLPRHLLNDLVTYSHEEGDFEWAIAYHPYPESLFQPRTWEDKKVNFTFDTPLITFKNIEVLDAWTKQPKTLYRGTKRRTIYLSEQGFNSPDYSTKSLADQAAGMAYAWKKIAHLDSIKAMQYHNWVDSRGEGGLRIGLRKFPDDKIDPMGRKPIWYLYQKLGTPEENKACAFAKPIIGITSWNQIYHTEPIPGIASGPTIRDVKSDTWVATDALGRTLPDYAEVGQPRPGRFVGIFYFLTFGSHGKPGPLDVTKSLAVSQNTAQWKPGTYYWGEPELGYYLSTDEWVIRRHADLLSDAGVDVIIFDTTNNKTFPAVYETIARVYEQMRSEGERTPKIAFLASAKSVDQLWANLYSKGLYKDLWFKWRGKPLLLTGQQIGMKRLDEFPAQIRTFFTLRQSWAWDSLPWYRDGHDQWPWVAHYPQVYGWNESPQEPEAVPVAVAEHPLSAIGRSFHNGQEPATDSRDVTPVTAQGKFFAEQWSRALTLDPEFIFVTGWNEWTAGSMRMGKDVAADLARWDFYPGAHLSRAGHPLKPGDLYFIDQYNEEFSRDIEPMKGGHSDDYYYQLAANIRRYKGVHAPDAVSLPQKIDLQGSFSQWDNVTPEFRDHAFDTLHRHASGNYKAGPYINDSGRNDIITLKVARDAENVYFYAETREPLTRSNGPFWMLLFIDADEKKSTGWEGYDYLVDAPVLNSRTTTIRKAEPDGRWGKATKVAYRTEGNKLMIAVPRSVLGQAKGRVAIDFHWADNIQKLGDINEFFLHGDSAPERRFNYRYVANDN